MSSNIILRSMAKVAIKYENNVPHGGIIYTSILKVQLCFDILPMSLLNICKTPDRILSWMKDVIPTALGKVLKE